MNCEKIESVTSRDLYPPPPPVTNCHTFSDPIPPWSVTYFMDGPFSYTLIIKTHQVTLFPDKIYSINSQIEDLINVFLKTAFNITWRYTVDFNIRPYFSYQCWHITCLWHVYDICYEVWTRLQMLKITEIKLVHTFIHNASLWKK